MTDRPIIFSGPMVRALLEGRKTMTRRLASSPLRKAVAGDRIWVRESLRRFEREPATAQYIADITGVSAPVGVARHPNGAALWQWRQKALPSIHMPRWASRLTLIVTATKVERLQAISDADATAEGIVEDDGSEPDIWYVPGAARAGWKVQMSSRPAPVFRSLWIALHGADSWNANPEVVALSFRVALANIDTPEASAA